MNLRRGPTVESCISHQEAVGRTGAAHAADFRAGVGPKRKLNGVRRVKSSNEIRAIEVVLPTVNTACGRSDNFNGWTQRNSGP